VSGVSATGVSRRAPWIGSGERVTGGKESAENRAIAGSDSGV